MVVVVARLVVVVWAAVVDVPPVAVDVDVLGRVVVVRRGEVVDAVIGGSVVLVTSGSAGSVVGDVNCVIASRTSVSAADSRPASATRWAIPG